MSYQDEARNRSGDVAGWRSKLRGADSGVRDVSRAAWIPAYSGSHENHGRPGMTTDPPADRQRNASRVFSDSVCTGKEFRDKSYKP